mgnify:CR=1 FL=1
MAEQALANLRVLDLSHYIAGPNCTKQLAGLGAEVIKVEKPGSGDGARSLGPFFGDDPHPEKSLLFFYLNDNKKSITLNLKTEKGKRILKELVKDADVLVENFEPRVMPSLGLSYETLREINPRLIMTSISNFGQTGPYRDYKAQDIVAYALGGYLYMTGSYEREPVKHGLNQAQMLAGLNGAVGTLTALASQRSSGVGQQVDVSIQETVNTALFFFGMWYTWNGAIWRRQPKGGFIYIGGLQGIMPCKDGWTAANVYRDAWDKFVAFIDIPELLEPKFADHPSRVANLKELYQIVGQKFMTMGKHELFHSAQEWGFPWATVQDVKDLAECPHLAARGFWTEQEHPVIGRLRTPTVPYDMAETPWRSASAAPLLGQHNREVYQERLGYSQRDLVRLRETGVI